MNDRTNLKRMFLTWGCHISTGLTSTLSAGLSPALNEIAASFSTSSEQAADSARILWGTNLFAMVLSAPVGGFLIRTYKQSVNSLIWISIFLSLIPLSAFILPSMSWFFVLQFILGFAIGLSTISPPAILSFIYSPAERLKIFGHRSGFHNFFALLYMLVGGWLAQFSWKLMYLIVVLNAFVVLLFSWYGRTYESSLNHEESVNDIKTPWTPIEIKDLTLIGALILVWGASFYLIQVQLPFEFRSRYNLNSMQISYALAFYTGIATLASWLLKTIHEWLGQPPFYKTHFILCMMTIAGFVIIPSLHNLIWVFISLGILGIARGVIMPTVQQWLSIAVSPPHRSAAFALLTLISRAAASLVPLYINGLIALGLGGALFYSNAVLFVFVTIVSTIILKIKKVRLD